MEQKFTVGGVLGMSFGTFFRNFPVLVGLCLVVHIPFNLFIYFLAMNEDQPGSAWGAGFIPFLSMLVFMLLLFLIQGAVAYGVYEDLSRRSFPLTRSVGIALRRLVPILLVSILASLMAGLASLLFIIPGIIVYCSLWVAVPVAVVERRGVFESLSRSRELTVGYRMRIFGLTAVFGIINFVFTMIMTAILTAIIASAGEGALLVSQIVSAVISAITGALGSVLTAVGYFMLRMDVEGVDLKDLVAVFE
jgi:hypothetical protein